MDLTGWNGHMEWADILHVLWIGVARDVTGTLLMEVAEFASFESTSYDGRLWDLHGQCVSWCRSHGIRPSTVEEWRALADFFFSGLCKRVHSRFKAIYAMYYIASITDIWYLSLYIHCIYENVDTSYHVTSDCQM